MPQQDATGAYTKCTCCLHIVVFAHFEGFAAQQSGEFRLDVTPDFAALAFYGAIEQVLTGWIFGLLPRGEAEYEQAKAFVVDTICGGLQAGPRAGLPARASD